MDCASSFDLPKPNDEVDPTAAPACALIILPCAALLLLLELDEEEEDDDETQPASDIGALELVLALAEGFDCTCSFEYPALIFLGIGTRLAFGTPLLELGLSMCSQLRLTDFGFSW